ncbi:MAG: hypothetical protein MHM6MM_000503 [Cercozoa sp. M6MM]
MTPELDFWFDSSAPKTSSAGSSKKKKSKKRQPRTKHPSKDDLDDEELWAGGSFTAVPACSEVPLPTWLQQEFERSPPHPIAVQPGTMPAHRHPSLQHEHLRQQRPQHNPQHHPQQQQQQQHSVYPTQPYAAQPAHYAQQRQHPQQRRFAPGPHMSPPRLPFGHQAPTYPSNLPVHLTQTHAHPGYTPGRPHSRE